MDDVRKIVIVGTGETANLADEYFSFDSPYEVVAFAVDETFRESDEFRGKPVVGMNELVTAFPPSKYLIFVAFGSGELNYQRTRMYVRVKEMGYTCVSYVSSRAFVWRNVEIGENCFIFENNTLQPFSKVGNNVIMWSGNHLGHQSVIEDNCFITSHVVISGYCRIGRNSFVGVNSSFADHVVVGADNFIAMGTCMNRSSGADEIWRGNPAMRMKLSAKAFCEVGK